MYFILSKILLYLLFPLSWIFVLLVIALTAKRPQKKRRFLIIAIVVLFIFSNTVIYNSFARLWDIPPHELKATDHYNCAIVLGGFSGESRIGGGHFNQSADRFIQSVLLLRTNKITHLLVSGGNGNLIPGSFREGAWVKTQLEALSFPDSAILIESNSKNTIENARFSNMLLKKSHLPGPYLLITSAFHMRRAAMIFKKEGINVVPYSCNVLTKQDRYSIDDYLIPSAENLSQWSLYLKEVIGYIVNSFNG
jgi:uncharacterized SAM-binding protein YcdF (DUF218 family)